MKRSLIITMLFLLSFGGVFAGEKCKYKEYKGVYDYIYNPTDLSDVVKIKEVQTGIYVVEYNGKVSQEFGIDGINSAGNSGLKFSNDGKNWQIFADSLDGKGICLSNFEPCKGEYNGDFSEYPEAYYLKKSFEKERNIMKKGTPNKKECVYIDGKCEKEYEKIGDIIFSENFQTYAYIGEKKKMK